MIALRYYDRFIVSINPLMLGLGPKHFNPRFDSYSRHSTTAIREVNLDLCYRSLFDLKLPRDR